MIAGFSLLAGLALSLLLGNPWQKRCQYWSPRLLKACVIGIGAGINLNLVLEIGLKGAAFTAAVVLSVIACGFVLSKLFKTDATTSILVTVGTAICGGSAIAAIAPILRAKSEQISMALITIFLCNAVALFLFPFIGHSLGLTEEQFGLWSALAVHDTSAVVGTAMQFGPTALAIATTVKLTRTLWIIPVALGLAQFFKTPGAPKAKFPLFVIGFFAMAALVSFVPALKEPGQILAQIARYGLILTLFLIGAGVSRESFRQVGVRSLALGVVLWLMVGTTTLLILKTL